MKQGDKIYWMYNGKQYSGVLEERMEVMASVDADKFMNNQADFEDTSYYSWDIIGSDLKRYSLPEKDLYLKPIKN